jgi:hypothetical protein
VVFYSSDDPAKFAQTAHRLFGWDLPEVRRIALEGVDGAPPPRG